MHHGEISHAEMHDSEHFKKSQKMLQEESIVSVCFYALNPEHAFDTMPAFTEKKSPYSDALSRVIVVDFSI